VEFGGIFLAPNPYTEPLPPDFIENLLTQYNMCYYRKEHNNRFLQMDTRKLLKWENQELFYMDATTNFSWKSYRTHPLRQPDIQMKLQFGTPSKGFTTMQKLLKEGYTY
jgi:hypothetical protein